ncbi:MAG: recombinase family protein [Dehalococcoidia bacterium]
MSKSQQRAAAYVRVSTEEQTEGHSLDAQRHEIARHCERHGFTLVRIYADEGVSAHTEKIEKRPQLVALLDAAARGEFDVVIVHTIDRWSRNVGVQRQALQRLGEVNVGFASVTENIDFTTPAGKLMLTMIGGVSEFFSDQLAVHVSKGQRERAEKGLPIGPVPFGYITSEPGGVPATSTNEGRAVQIAFERRATGASYGEIARWLNAEGFETRGKNTLFTPFAIKDMLKNRFYLGVVKYRGEEINGQHEPLVDEELFERVRARRGGEPAARSMHGARGLLQGRLHCGHCGSKLHSERNRREEPRYRERHGVPCVTNGRSVLSHRIDEQIADIWRAIEFAPDWRDRMADLTSQQYQGPNLVTLNDRRRRLARAFADGAYSDAEYLDLRTAVDEQLRAATRVVGPSYEAAAAIFEDIPAMWERARPDERRTLLDPLIERLYVDIDSGLLGALTPTPAFRDLLDHAMQRTEASRAVLLTSEELRQIMSGVGMVETGES